MSEFTSEEERLLCHLYLVLDVNVPNCGCGWPQAARQLVWELLALMPTYGNQRKRHLRELIGPEGSQQIVLCALERAELITHGVSVDSAALAPRGHWVLWAVEQVGGTAGLDAKLETVGYPHTDRECDADCWTMPDDWAPAQEPPAPPEAVPVAVPCPGPSCARYLYGIEHQHTEQPAAGPAPRSETTDGPVDLVAALERLYALRWDLTPPACPGPSCLLHGTEHQHTGRQR